MLHKKNTNENPALAIHIVLYNIHLLRRINAFFQRDKRPHNQGQQKKLTITRLRFNRMHTLKGHCT